MCVDVAKLCNCRCWQTSHQHTTTAQIYQKSWRPVQQQQQTCNLPGGCTTHIKGVLIAVDFAEAAAAALAALCLEVALP
jgi:hypothetical protein